VMTSQTHMDTPPKEHIMVTQSRLTTRRSARFLGATIQARMVVACCGLVLLSAVSAYAELPFNGLPMNGIPLNGLPVNGITTNGAVLNGWPINGMPINGLPANESSLPTVQNESLPWNTLSQRALGKHQPPSCKGTLCRP
jgi:hypothetical protein